MDRWRLALTIAVLVQAAAATAGAVYLVVGLATQEAVDAAGAAWEAVAAGVLALALWLLAGAAARGRRWARGPLLTWQLIGVPVSLSMANSRLWPLGIALLLCCLGGLAAAVRPTTFGGPGELPA